MQDMIVFECPISKFLARGIVLQGHLRGHRGQQKGHFVVGFLPSLFYRHYLPSLFNT